MAHRRTEPTRIAAKGLVLTVALGMAVGAQSLSAYASGDYGMRPPANVGFVQTASWPPQQLGRGESLGYTFNAGLKVEVEGPDLGKDISPHGGFFSPAWLSVSRPAPSGLYEQSDGVWPPSDRVAAYQPRSSGAAGLSGKLFGSLEYRWTNGSLPSLSIVGVPTKVKVRRHGVVVGVNYHF